MATRLQHTTPTKPSTLRDSNTALPKTAAFIPPFLKNVKPENRRSAVLKDKTQAQSAFVPPFRKQRSVVLKSSSKPQEEEEAKLQCHLVTPCTSNSCAPPTKKTQSTTDEIRNRMKDIQMLNLSDTVNTQHMYSRKHPVGCGSEDSASEAVCVQEPQPRTRGAATLFFLFLLVCLFVVD